MEALSDVIKAGVSAFTVGGGAANAGTAEVDFGAHPGSDLATVSVTGQAAIVAGSVVEAWLVAKGTTDHSADEHIIDGPQVFAGNIIAGTGFTIYAIPRNRPPAEGGKPEMGARSRSREMFELSGRWSVGWRWS